MAVGRSGRAPTSGAIAASEADVSATTGRRGDESVTRSRLEIERAGTDGGARGMAGAWSLAIDGGSEAPLSARRCTMGRSTDGKSCAGDDVALGWTVGVIGRPFPARVSSRAGVSSRANLPAA